MELTPAERLAYYQRALDAFTEPAYGRYSCIVLGEMLIRNHCPEWTDTYEMLIRALLPDYWQVLADTKRAQVGKWDRALIQPWPANEEGNKQRVEALQEAIRRVSLLIKQQ
jgi:hypothetical protein